MVYPADNGCHWTQRLKQAGSATAQYPGKRCNGDEEHRDENIQSEATNLKVEYIQKYEIEITTTTKGGASLATRQCS
ncbi:hypothetical protein Ddc_18719 [Ditylenchus destructor]|nr:hypothetical protein Ddc_18719 [Ditylenchus destructor]